MFPIHLTAHPHPNPNPNQSKDPDPEDSFYILAPSPHHLPSLPIPPQSFDKSAQLVADYFASSSTSHLFDFIVLEQA